MAPLIPIIVLVVFGVPIAVAIWLIVRAVNAGNTIEELSHRLRKVEFELSQLNQAKVKESPRPAAATPAVPPAPAPVSPPPVDR